MSKIKLTSPFRITKNIGISRRDTWLIRIGGIVLAFLLAGLLCSILRPGSFFDFYYGLIKGCFSSTKRILNVVCAISIYLLLSIAVTPAFKMKFWNIGVEGQTLVGCIASAVILYMFPKSIPDPLVIVIALIGAIGAGMIFALIPAFFKIKFKTNETLFTLLMNYVATPLALFTCAMVDKSGHNLFPQIGSKFPGRLLLEVGGVKYLPIIICAVAITVLMYFYLKKTKQGFELSVMGDSINTARYVGISRKVVSYRTMAISGAIAGLVGFLLVCCQNGTLTSTLVGGRGFTAVLIAWLGYFNPGEIALYAFLVGFLDYGTGYVAGLPSVDLDTTYFSGLIIGLFILTVVVIEFFTRYKVNRCLPSAVSEIRDQILNYPDSKVNRTVLLGEFSNIEYRNFKIKFSKEKIDFKKQKQQYSKKTKQIRKQLFSKNNLNEKDRNALTETLKTLRRDYQAVLKQYNDDKKLLKVKKQSEKVMMKANATRLKSVIKNKIATTLVVLKSGSVVYGSKDEIKNFLNSVNYTKWEFDSKATIGNLLKARSEMLKSNKLFDKKNKENIRILSKDIEKTNEVTFNYYLINNNFIIRNYLKRRKIYFTFMVKHVNRVNIRNLKKKKKLESRMQNKGNE